MEFMANNEKTVFRCEVCDVFVNSEMQLVQHRTGKMHTKKLREDLPEETEGKEKIRKNADMDPITQAVVNNALGKLPTKRKAQPQVTCNACNLTFNSDLQATQHYQGSRHAKKVRLMEAAKEMETEEATSAAENDTNGDDLGKKLGLFFCGYCNISVNSLQQLDAHKSGSKHKNKVAKAEGKTDDDKEVEISDDKDSD